MNVPNTNEQDTPGSSFCSKVKIKSTLETEPKGEISKIFSPKVFTAEQRAQ
jgi:hypothetical protein